MSLSSSPPTIFTDKFYTIKTPAPVQAPGCFSGVIRRILCSGGLPTYPFDKFKEPELELELESADRIHPFLDKIVDSRSPNLVARLMGLNSMPEKGIGETRMACESLSRSKSMNSMDWRLEEVRMMVEVEEGRLMKSRSLRETPVSLEVEDDEFLVLRFDNVSRIEDCDRGFELEEGKQRKNATRNNRVKQRKHRKCSDVVDDELRVMSDEALSPRNGSLMAVTGMRDSGEVKWRKRRKKKRGKYEGDRESVSSNSSPVSVLDHAEFTTDHDVSNPEDDSSSRGSSSATTIRNLTVEILDDEYPSDYTNGISKQFTVVEPIADGGKDHLSTKFSLRICDKYSADLLSNIYRLAEDEVKESYSAHNNRKQMVNGGLDWEDVGAEVGSQIFDQLIDDLVAVLVAT